MCSSAFGHGHCVCFLPIVFGVSTFGLHISLSFHRFKAPVFHVRQPASVASLSCRIWAINFFRFRLHKGAFCYWMMPKKTVEECLIHHDRCPISYTVADWGQVDFEPWMGCFRVWLPLFKLHLGSWYRFSLCTL